VQLRYRQKRINLWLRKYQQLKSEDKLLGDDVTASTPIFCLHVEPAAPSGDYSSNVNKLLLYAYGLVDTFVPNRLLWSTDENFMGLKS